MNEIGRHELDLRFELCMQAYCERVFEKNGISDIRRISARDFSIRIGGRLAAPREKTLRRVGPKLATGR